MLSTLRATHARARAASAAAGSSVFVAGSVSVQAKTGRAGRRTLGFTQRLHTGSPLVTQRNEPEGSLKQVAVARKVQASALCVVKVLSTFPSASAMLRCAAPPAYLTDQRDDSSRGSTLRGTPGSARLTERQSRGGRTTSRLAERKIARLRSGGHDQPHDSSRLGYGCRGTLGDRLRRLSARASVRSTGATERKPCQQLGARRLETLDLSLEHLGRPSSGKFVP
ncbi:hypothetical protein LDDCCGHA_1669 [Methylobacterium oxalidis]|nr:hypothetical protein LDDCCGHA_1669 [Methylobacterium oxalidis]